MKKKIIFISIAFAIGLTLAACSNTDNSNLPITPLINEKEMTEIELKPSHKDKYGCVFADRYEWCEATKQCIKEGEICESDPNTPQPEYGYNLIQKAFLSNNPDLNPIDFKIGIQKLTLSHFRGFVRWTDGRPDTQLLVSKENNDWMIVYYGESGQYTCELVEPFSFPSEMIADCQI